MKTKVLERLENLLAHWENYCELTYLGSLTQQVFPELRAQHGGFVTIDEPLIHCRTLRKFILDHNNKKLNIERYVCGKTKEFEEFWLTYEPLATFPLTLFNWCRHSRRAYNLSGELTDLLLMTKVDDVLWDDIRFPFSTFIIDLEDGFTDLVNGVHKFILVDCVHEDNKNKLVLTSIGTENAQLLPIIGRHKFLETRSAIQHRKYERVASNIMEMLHETKAEKSAFVAPFYVENGKTVAESIQQRKEIAAGQSTAMGDQDEIPGFCENLHDIEANILRIVIGFTMYLKTLPADSPNISSWQDLHTSSKDKYSVTNGATICTVTSSVKLSPNDQKILHEQIAHRGKGYEVRAHFREGHWRRPPGKGNDPAAEKTVWVKPCLVRADRLDTGEPLIGLEQKT